SAGRHGDVDLTITMAQMGINGSGLAAGAAEIVVEFPSHLVASLAKEVTAAHLQSHCRVRHIGEPVFSTEVDGCAPILRSDSEEHDPHVLRTEVLRHGHVKYIARLKAEIEVQGRWKWSYLALQRRLAKAVLEVQHR